MMDKLMKLIAEKKQKHGDMSPIHAKAKHHVLKDLMDEMHGMDGEKVKGLKKVTVASNSPEGLEHGLEQAKDIVGHGGKHMEHLAKGGLAGMGEMMDEDMAPEHEEGETDMEPEHDEAEGMEHMMDGEDDEHAEEEHEGEEHSEISSLEEKLKEIMAELEHLKSMK